MQVNVTIKDIATINTGTADRENQPLAQFIIEVERQESGKTVKGEVKFTEMLSTIADMTATELDDHFLAVITDYVRTALKGQSLVDPSTNEWINKDKYIGRGYTIEI